MARPKYSRFYLSDLHVHTAADADHRYGPDAGPRDPNEAFAAKLVGAFADAGVTVIAVTDHNRVDWWPVMKAAGDQCGVTVFPGVEINVNRCHLLGIWDATEEGYRLAERFTKSRHKPKSVPYLNGAPRPVDFGNVEDNATAILEHGGLVIAPHATSKNIGLFAPGVCSNADELARGELISAFDVFGNKGADVLKNPQSRFGRVSPRWLLTGDTRAFEDVGSRAVFLKLGAKPTLEGLRQAFLSPRTRIRFPERSRSDWGRVDGVRFTESPEPDWPRLTGVTVQGGFHDGLDVRLAPGLNAIIGGKGTGKSAFIELVRHVSGAKPSEDKLLIDNRVRTFPPNADATLTFVAADGESYESRRSGGSAAPGLYREGKPSDVAVDRRLAVQVFGQRELQGLREPDALRAFVANHAGPDWTSALDEERASLRALTVNEKALGALEAALVLLNEQASERADYGERIERAKAAGIEKVVARIAALGKLDRAIREALLWPATVREVADAQRGLLPRPAADGDPEFGTRLAAALDPLAGAIAASLTAVETPLAVAEAAVPGLRKDWELALAKRRAALERDLADIGVRNPQEFAAWQEKVAELDQELAGLPVTLEEHRKAREERDKLLGALHSQRRAKSRILEKAAGELGVGLPSRVRLRHEPFADRTPISSALERAVRGQGVRADQLDRLAAIEPQAIARAINDGAESLMKLGLSGTTATKLAALTPSQKRAIELADGADLIRLEMDMSGSGSGDWRDVGEVSQGQRATALLALVLTGGNAPLVIDQPEDDLDNRFIYEDIVTALIATCERRQVIVATHNANIPILGDAELLVAFDANDKRSRVLAIGGLEIREVATRAKEILEGGEEAFRARERRYRAPLP